MSRKPTSTMCPYLRPPSPSHFYASNYDRSRSRSPPPRRRSRRSRSRSPSRSPLPITKKGRQHRQLSRSRPASPAAAPDSCRRNDRSNSRRAGRSRSRSEGRDDTSRGATGGRDEEQADAKVRRRRQRERCVRTPRACCMCHGGIVSAPSLVPRNMLKRAVLLG